jgi:hypothetical protein
MPFRQFSTALGYDSPIDLGAIYDGYLAFPENHAAQSILGKNNQRARRQY